MMVNGGQITVCWHVDDLKISHRDEAMVNEFVMALADEFGPKTMISRGKVHDYLVMDLDFGTIPGTMLISMIKYLQKRIDEFPEVLRGTKVCPAVDNLFKVRDDKDRELLSEEMAKQFHQTVAQLLFLCKRARPDVKTLVSILGTRVKQPDKDDLGN